MGNCFSVQLSGGDALIQRCRDCIAPRCNNLPHLHSNIQKLCNERDYLRAAKDEVNQRVANQQGPLTKQREVVRVWVSKVDDKLAEADRLIIQGENEKNNLCLGGYCSKTCCSSYTLASMVAELLADVIALKETGNFEAVVERVVAEPAYISQLENNLIALQAATEELKALKNDVTRRVDVDEGPQMKQLDQVRLWISRVDLVVPEFDSLIKDGPQEIQRMRNGDTSFSIFGERVAKALTEAIAEKQKGKFEAVVGRVPIEAVMERPGEPSVGLESAVGKVWKWLMNEDVGVIGIYGMGGIGKTTLLTEINNRFLKSPHGFDFVIWVVASKDFRLENIQEDIAGQMGLPEIREWKELRFSEKTTIMHKFLQKRKFVMLVDDLWNRIELKDIGVPSPNKQNMSKVVFTTRSETICGEMEAQKSILLTPIPWQKAWQLFQEKVGRKTLEADVDIPNLAQDVARECAGLPLALVAVGRAMACRKTAQDWKHALQILKTSAAAFRGMGNNIFPKLKFSYDNLPGEKEKSCLLYCSLFPEEYLIPKDELIQKWICESFWDDDNRQIDPIIEGYSIISTIVHACLLEDKGECVKMHDVIRDMCLWIACEVEEDKENYFVRAGSRIKKAPNMGKLTEVKRISLMQNSIQQLTEIPETPNLLTLLLGFNKELNLIGDGFFQHMKMLRVLDLSNTGLNVLPTEIGELVSLQHLDISATQIAKLPLELTELKKLKCFYFEYMTKLREIPRQIISSFPSLQILRMRGCGMDLDMSMVEEFENLEDLKELSIRIFDLSILSHFLRSCKISRCIRCLEILEISDCSSSREEIFETETKILGNLHRSLGKICFDNIQKVNVSYLWTCYFPDLTWLSLAPNLTELKVTEVSGLQEIISYSKLSEVRGKYKSINLFKRLKVLALEDLEQLKSIYLKPLHFPSLNRIRVARCPILKKLPLNTRSAEGRNVVIEGKKMWWDRLEWEDEATLSRFACCFRDSTSAEKAEEFMKAELISKAALSFIDAHMNNNIMPSDIP